MNIIQINGKGRESLDIKLNACLILGGNGIGKTDALKIICNAINSKSSFPKGTFSIYLEQEDNVWEVCRLHNSILSKKAFFLDNITNYRNVVTTIVDLMSDVELDKASEMFNSFSRQMGGYSTRSDNGKINFLKDGLTVSVSSVMMSAAKLFVIVCSLVSKKFLAIVDDIDTGFHINIQIKLSSMIKTKSFESSSPLLLIASTHSPAMTIDCEKMLLEIER